MELLQALHSRSVPLAILTRSNQEALEWTLQKFALEQFFPPNLRISRDFSDDQSLTPMACCTLPACVVYQTCSAC